MHEMKETLGAHKSKKEREGRKKERLEGEVKEFEEDAEKKKGAVERREQEIAEEIDEIRRLEGQLQKQRGLLETAQREFETIASMVVRKNREKAEQVRER